MAREHYRGTEEKERQRRKYSSLFYLTELQCREADTICTQQIQIVPTPARQPDPVPRGCRSVNVCVCVRCDNTVNIQDI